MASFTLYIPLLTAAEGGYQKLAADSGNYNSRGQLVGTNHGISAPVYEAWIGRVPTEADMRSITKTVALEIMKAWYWNKMQASSINNQSIANILVDHAVNAGTGAAAKLVQEVLNDYFDFNLAVDGGIGPITISAINSAPEYQLHEALKIARKQFYENIGGGFLDTWLDRIEMFVFEKKKS
ncbi:MAG: glycoside hydrolase family 108 protein [Flavobacteriales bacterium]